MEQAEVDARLQRSELRLAGLIATAVVLAGLWVVGTLSSGVPFGPTSLAEAIIRVVPGDVSTFFIELLGHWAIRLLGFGALAAALAFGALAPAWSAGGGEPKPFLVGVGLAGLDAVAIVLGPIDKEDPAAMVVVLGGAALVYGLVTRGLYESLVSARDTDSSRRRAIRLGIAGIGGIAVSGGVLGWFSKRFGGPDTDVPLVVPAVRASLPERPPFPDIPGLSPEVTSAADHYVVDINLVPPSVEADRWDLTVGGLVDRPLTLTFQQLQQRFEVVEEHSVLTCISNEVGGNLVGNSVWGGVRLKAILEGAGASSSAVDVIFRADDGYSDSIPIDVAMDPSVIVAVSQNGRPLTQEHGFPCRVRVPMIYGMKNVKWLREIEVVDFNYQGYWMERGWSDVATVRTQSRIDVAGENRRADVGRATWIAGVAWSGGRGISRVEVSTDGGSTWDEAMLRTPINRFSWTLWAYRWTPEASGETVVVCRATDGEGDTQTADVGPPHPSGATGWDRLRVSVG